MLPTNLKDRKLQQVRMDVEDGMLYLDGAGEIRGSVYRNGRSTQDVVRAAVYGPELKDFEWSVRLRLAPTYVIVEEVAFSDLGERQIEPSHMPADTVDRISQTLSKYGLLVAEMHRSPVLVVFSERGPTPADFEEYECYRNGLVRIDWNTHSVITEVGMLNGNGEAVLKDAERVQRRLLNRLKIKDRPVLEVVVGSVSLRPEGGLLLEFSKTRNDPEKAVADLVADVVELALDGRPQLNQHYLRTYQRSSGEGVSVL